MLILEIAAGVVLGVVLLYAIPGILIVAVAYTSVFIGGIVEAFRKK